MATKNSLTTLTNQQIINEIEIGFQVQKMIVHELSQKEILPHQIKMCFDEYLDHAKEHINILSNYKECLSQRSGERSISRNKLKKMYKIFLKASETFNKIYLTAYKAIVLMQSMTDDQLSNLYITLNQQQLIT